MRSSLRWGWGITIEALVSDEGDLVFRPECDGEPVEWTEDGSNMVVFAYSHQDSGGAILDILKPVEALNGESKE